MSEGTQIDRRALIKLLGVAAIDSAALKYMTAIQPTPARSPGQDFFITVPPERSGITWVHDNAHSDSRFLPETTGAGCAFFDYDNDGWMDIFLVNSGPCYFYQPAKSPSCALYKNNRDGTFTDVTAKAGVQGNLFGMGVAIGDYDRDGFQDIFVTGFERSILYRNNGNGTFKDVTSEAGLSDSGWSTSAVWFDFDNDGYLDLFVCHYVEFVHRTQDLCGSTARSKIYCAPQNFPAAASRLYRNNRDGTFTDITESSGVSKHKGKSLGVVAADINNDGWMDLFVGNDTTANFLFVNSSHGTMSEIGFDADVAYNDEGSARSGMGVDAADFDRDGKIDLFVSNIDHEMYALYRNAGENRFHNISKTNDIGATTLMMSGWGAHFLDYNNDGWLDLMCVNGHPDDLIDRTGSLVKYKERLLLFRNDGKKFSDVSEQAGSAFRDTWSARGLAVGDFDNDGSIDALVLVNGGAPVLLQNVGKWGNNWIGVYLIGVRANVDAIGAEIRWSIGGQRFSRQKTGGGSFLSSHDPRVLIGLGEAKGIDWLEIHWPQPSGGVERFTDVPINQYVSITETAGKLLPYPLPAAYRSHLRAR